MEVIKYRVSPDAEWQSIVALKGEPGKDGAPGKDGEPGKDYVLTDNDKQEIANLVIASLPVSEEVEY